ncbi:MAG: hypothetical protein J2P40_06185 [Candidatus Dormibacteraeota bacterium]|nr:hypothetical protein [Candidatus Dormibacteraeota bacterium]MBO0704159.1 hypothetical protein [Candidatus Dormibacteraeota bacterium]MBO0760844.1 hypothetical protein [Candidatus Dormibacteraeota bacterium]
MIGHSFLSRLSAQDLRLLAERSAGLDPDGTWDESGLEAALGDPAVFRALFEEDSESLLVRVSPFLVFAVLVHRVRQELGDASFLEERVGTRQRVPVFDVAGPRGFLEAPHRRLFLADLLASYTRVAGGSIWYHTPRGWRRRRFSELDPVRLAGLLEVVPEVQQPAILRRFGDLCLFLTGVFAEHVAAHPLEPRHLERLSRVLAVDHREAAPSELVLAGGGGIWELDWLGTRAYRLAAAQAEESRQLLQEISGGFGQARRVLDLLTRRHLQPRRGEWFGRPGGS